MKYKEWLNEWLALYVKSAVKARTCKKYDDIIRLHIVPNLGDIDMDDLSAVVLQRYILELSMSGNHRKAGAGLSANTVNVIVSVIKNSLEQAVNSDVLNKHYAEKIQRPKAREKKVECFTVEEQKKIEKYILSKNCYRLFGIILDFYLGLRIGELLALKWSDIDFSKEILYVNKTCYDSFANGKYEKVITAPKTESSIRDIPVPRQVTAILKQLLKHGHSDYIVSGKGQGISVRSYQRSFELLLKRLEITHKGFHSIRHSFATRALECGMDVKTLSELLGHKNSMITLNRYAHSMLDHKTAMMNKYTC